MAEYSQADPAIHDTAVDGASISRTLANLAREPLRIACRAKAYFNTSRKIVLLYHSIGDSKYAVSAKMFADQMAYLADNARVLDLEHLLTEDVRATGPSLTCAITFDDGYENFYQSAFPVLNRFRFPSLIYITTEPVSPFVPQTSDGYPGLLPGERMLTWEQVKELSQQGVRIGSHLRQHKDMTRLTREEALAELVGSKEAISQNLGLSCDHFAYPFGRFHSNNIACVAQAGYRWATTVEHHTVTSQPDRLKIPRMCIAPIHGFDDFKAILRGDLDYLFMMQKVRDAFGFSYSI